jgi:hypothetical protein
MDKQAETDLDSRIQALETGAKFDATQDAIRQREMEFLTTLREVRAAMVEQGTGANSAELEQLKKENEQLKVTVEKQQYRITHLITGLESYMQMAE